MSFKKLPQGLDKSDIELWARNRVATTFLKEVMVHRENALRALIKKPTDELAAVVRAYDSVERLFEEAKNLK